MFGTVSEVLTHILHANTYILYLVGPPALLGTIAAGGIPRTLRGKPAIYWCLFSLYMLVATPFSTWVGNSFQQELDYFRFCLPLMFVVGGLAVNWKDVKGYFYTIGYAAILNLVAARFFASSEDGRISLDASGTIGNSNDLSSHLIIVLPFLLYIATDAKTKFIVRIPLFGALAYGLWVIVGTASRGALISITVMFILALWRAAPWQRVLVLIAGVLLAVSLPLLLPTQTLIRLGSMFGGQVDAEAADSSGARSYLLQQSLIYTLQHPMFGVGPNQFANFEGKSQQSAGEHAEWHETHNAYTQVSSECGVPALVFFVSGILSALFTVMRTWRRARKEGVEEISRACYYFVIAFSGYLVSIIFLANAYRFYLPAMIGLAIAIQRAGSRYIDEYVAARPA